MSLLHTVRMAGLIVANQNLVPTPPTLSLEAALAKASRVHDEPSSTDPHFYDDLASLREHDLSKYNLVLKGFLRESKMAFVCEEDVCNNPDPTNPRYTIRCAPGCVHRPHWASGEDTLEAFVEAKDLFALQPQAEPSATERPSDHCIPCPNLLEGISEAEMSGSQTLSSEPAMADTLANLPGFEAPPYYSTIFQQWRDTLYVATRRDAGRTQKTSADYLADYRDLKEQQKAGDVIMEPPSAGYSSVPSLPPYVFPPDPNDPDLGFRLNWKAIDALIKRMERRGIDAYAMRMLHRCYDYHRQYVRFLLNMENGVASTVDTLMHLREMKDERDLLIQESRITGEEASYIDNNNSRNLVVSRDTGRPPSQSFKHARILQLEELVKGLHAAANEVIADLTKFLKKQSQWFLELRQRKEAAVNDIRDFVAVEMGRKSVKAVNDATKIRMREDHARHMAKEAKSERVAHKQRELARTAEMARQASEAKARKLPPSSKIVASSTEELKNQLQPIAPEPATRQPTVRKDSTQTSPATPASIPAKSNATPISTRSAGQQQQREAQRHDGHTTSISLSPLPPPVPDNPSFGDLAAYPMKPESLGMGNASLASAPVATMILSTSRQSAILTLPSQVSSVASSASQAPQPVDPTSSYSPLVPTFAKARTSGISPQQYGQYTGVHGRMSSASTSKQQGRQTAPTVNNMVPQGSPKSKHRSQVPSPVIPKTLPSQQRQTAPAAIITTPPIHPSPIATDYIQSHIPPSMVSLPLINAGAAGPGSSQSVQRSSNVASSPPTMLYGQPMQRSPLRTPSNMVLASHAPNVSHMQQQWAQQQSQPSKIMHMAGMTDQQYHAQMQYLQRQTQVAQGLQNLQSRLPQQQLIMTGSTLYHPQAQHVMSRQMQGAVPSDFHVRSLSLDQRQGAPWLCSVNPAASGFRGGNEMAGVPEEAVVGGSDEDGEYELDTEQ